MRKINQLLDDEIHQNKTSYGSERINEKKDIQNPRNGGDYYMDKLLCKIYPPNPADWKLVEKVNMITWNLFTA